MLLQTTRNTKLWRKNNTQRDLILAENLHPLKVFALPRLPSFPGLFGQYWPSNLSGLSSNKEIRSEVLLEHDWNSWSLYVKWSLCLYALVKDRCSGCQICLFKLVQYFNYRIPKLCKWYCFCWCLAIGLFVWKGQCDCFQSYSKTAKCIFDIFPRISW